jgi:hypothetical protein
MGRSYVQIIVHREHPWACHDLVAQGNSDQIQARYGAPLFRAGSVLPDRIPFACRLPPRTVIFTSGDDVEAKKLVIELINSTGFVAIDLGSLAKRRRLA